MECDYECEKVQEPKITHRPRGLVDEKVPLAKDYFLPAKIINCSLVSHIHSFKLISFR